MCANTRYTHVHIRFACADTTSRKIYAHKYERAGVPISCVYSALTFNHINRQTKL